MLKIKTKPKKISDKFIILSKQCAKFILIYTPPMIFTYMALLATMFANNNQNSATEVYQKQSGYKENC